MKALSTVVLLAALAPLSANSAPVTWVVDVSLNDSAGTGTITGTFDFDNLSSTFSNVNLSAVGDMFAASSATLDSHIADFSSSTFIEAVPDVADLTGLQDVFIEWGGTLSAVGGSRDVLEIIAYTCDNADCSNATKTYTGTPLDGSTVSAIPIPAAAWLFGSGLLGLIGVARRRKAA